MKRIAILVTLLLLLTACGSKGIKDNKFTFDEDDFRDTYAEVSGKSAPVGLEYNGVTVTVDGVSSEQVEYFLESAYELLGDKDIKEMHNSFKDDRDELVAGEDEKWRKVEGNDRMFLDYGLLEDGTYTSSVYVNLN